MPDKERALLGAAARGVFNDMLNLMDTQQKTIYKLERQIQITAARAKKLGQYIENSDRDTTSDVDVFVLYEGRPEDLLAKFTENGITTITTNESIVEDLLNESYFGRMKKVKLPGSVWSLIQQSLAGGEEIENNE